ncbi:MAG: F0F1 ATP synthase subunit delta [Candidatus Pacebacteria bacterium]|nr:F0F1 ATP synthase subunit delta [Candidatus Paceibacterota bacterium]
MKYKPKQYAEALYGVLDEKSGDEKKLIKQFVLTLKKNRDSAKLPLILKHFEKIFTEKNGLIKVEVESAQELSPKVRKEIESAVGGKALFEEKINPKLLAGVRILLNDSIFIDSSALRHITNVFSK